MQFIPSTVSALALLPTFLVAQIETNPTATSETKRLSALNSPHQYTIKLLQNKDLVPSTFGRILGENPSVTTFALDFDKQQFVANGLIAQNQSSGFMLTGNAGVANENQFKNLFLGAGINPKAMAGLQMHFANKTKIEFKNTLSTTAYAQQEIERERLIEQQLKNTNAAIEALQKAGKTSETSEKLSELMVKKQLQLDSLNFSFMVKQSNLHFQRYAFSYNTLGANIETSKYDFLPTEIGTDTNISAKKYVGWELFYQYNHVIHNSEKQRAIIHGLRLSFSQKNNVADLNPSFIRQETGISTQEKEARFFTAYNSLDYANIHYLRIAYDMTYLPLRAQTYNVGVILGIDMLFHPKSIDNQLKFNGGFVFPFSFGNSENPMALSAILSGIYRSKTTFIESAFDNKAFFVSYNLRLTKAIAWKKH